MRRSFLAAMLSWAVACVSVPDGIHAEFAPAGAADRSNYRPGTHGSAPPAEDPPSPKASAAAAPPSADAAPEDGAEDAGAAAPAPADDGGSP